MAKLDNAKVYINYAIDNLKDVATSLTENYGYGLTEEEYKKIHEWLLRISNAAEDARQICNSRAGSASPPSSSKPGKSTTASSGKTEAYSLPPGLFEPPSVKMTADDYSQYLDTLKRELEKAKRESRANLYTGDPSYRKK
jgi:hypothetical protein